MSTPTTLSCLPLMLRNPFRPPPPSIFPSSFLPLRNVVDSLAVRCVLVNGKYVRDHTMLEVPTGRWLVNQLLESCMSDK